MASVERKQKDNLQFNSAFIGKGPVSWHGKSLKVSLKFKTILALLYMNSNAQI